MNDQRDLAAADLTDPVQLEHFVDQAGAVDVLVNNAGSSWFGRPRN
jgi:short-subunit dehydrogenase